MPSGSAVSMRAASCGAGGVGRSALQGAVDVEERLVGFEEEVPGHPDIAQHPVHDVQVDDDELAARHLVFTVHGASSSMSSSARPPARPVNQP
ncbi:hypothetical protein GCM10020000_15640 [Streptomyces olivoverticillatus]